MDSYLEVAAEKLGYKDVEELKKKLKHQALMKTVDNNPKGQAFWHRDHLQWVLPKKGRLFINIQNDMPNENRWKAMWSGLVRKKQKDTP